MSEEEKSIQATQWVKSGGGMITNRNYLNLNHPESWVSLWKKKYGDLLEFPWEQVYGRVPTEKELFDAGIRICPVCGNKIESEQEKESRKFKEEMDKMCEL